MQFGLLTVGGFGMLLAITQDSDDPVWDHRSLQLLMETWAADKRG
jgi:hypothetical protein